MPEGPEVRKIADVLEKAVGKYLTEFHIVPDSKYKFYRDGIPGCKMLTTELDRGHSYLVEKIIVKGKLIRIDLKNDLFNPPGISILNTLGMSGTWRWTDTGKHVRLILRFDKPGAPDSVRFCDQRGFGNVKVVSRVEAIKAVNTIGWDLLQGPMLPKSWRALQQKQYFKDKAIGPALLEQKIASGIGNIYKAEILYELGIYPTTKIKDVDSKVWEKVNITAHKILRNSYNAGGSSVRNYSAGGKKGNYQKVLQIYNKKKCPLGHNTAKLKQKSRNTWYCPKCQLK